MSRKVQSSLESSDESSDDSSGLSLRWWTGFFPAGLGLHLAPGLLRWTLWMYPVLPHPWQTASFKRHFSRLWVANFTTAETSASELWPSVFPLCGRRNSIHTLRIRGTILLSYLLGIVCCDFHSLSHFNGWSEGQLFFSARNFCWILLLLIPQISLSRNMSSSEVPKLQNSANKHSSETNVATVSPGFLKQLLNRECWTVSEGVGLKWSLSALTNSS